MTAPEVSASQLGVISNNSVPQTALQPAQTTLSTSPTPDDSQVPLPPPHPGPPSNQASVSPISYQPHAAIPATILPNPYNNDSPPPPPGVHFAQTSYAIPLVSTGYTDHTSPELSDEQIFKLRLTVNDKKFMMMVKGSVSMAEFAKLIEKQYFDMFLHPQNPAATVADVKVMNVVDQFDYAVHLSPQHLVKDSLVQDQYLAATVEIGNASFFQGANVQGSPNPIETKFAKVEPQFQVQGHIVTSVNSSANHYPIYRSNVYETLGDDDRPASPPPPPPPGPPPAFAHEGPVLAQVLATRLPTRHGSPLGTAIRTISNVNGMHGVPPLNLGHKSVLGNEDEMSDSDVPLSQVVAKERHKKKVYSPGVVVNAGPVMITPQFIPSPHTFINPPQVKLSQHQQQPEGEELPDGSWKCLKCEKILTSRRALWRHEVNAHQMPTNYQCSYCLKFLTGPSKLNKHIRLHLGIKDFQCNICANRLSSRRQLDMHMRLHSKDPKYTCQQCNRSFTRTSNLKSHMRTHTGEKPFKCKTCGRAFAHKFVLQRHERVHTGETPFICHICHKGFKQSSNLKVHLRNHSDERPYKCNLCAKAFKQNANLIAHLRSAHRVRPVSRKNMAFSSGGNPNGNGNENGYQAFHSAAAMGQGPPPVVAPAPPPSTLVHLPWPQTAAQHIPQEQPHTNVPHIKPSGDSANSDY